MNSDKFARRMSEATWAQWVRWNKHCIEMNKHKNKNRQQQTERAPMFIEEAPQQDAMPAQVATELLCAVLPTTNRMRKTYWAARSKSFQSTLRPQELSDKFARRMSEASWAQLVRWNKRCGARRMEIQKAWEKTKSQRAAWDEKAKAEKDENKRVPLLGRILILDRAIALLELKGDRMTLGWDVIDDEIRARQKKCKR